MDLGKMKMDDFSLQAAFMAWQLVSFKRALDFGKTKFWSQHWIFPKSKTLLGLKVFQLDIHFSQLSYQEFQLNKLPHQNGIFYFRLWKLPWGLSIQFCQNENLLCQNENLLCQNENKFCQNENQLCQNENLLCQNENLLCQNENQLCQNENQLCQLEMFRRQFQNEIAQIPNAHLNF